MAAGRESASSAPVEFVTSPYVDSSYKGNVTNSIEHPSPQPENASPSAGRPRDGSEAFPRYRYRLQGKRQGSAVAVDIDKHPDPRTAFAVALGVIPADFAEWQLEFPDFRYLQPVQPTTDSPPLQPKQQGWSLWPDLQIVEMKPVVVDGRCLRRTALLRITKPRPCGFDSRLPVWSKRPPLIKRDVPMWLERLGL